MEVLVSSFQVGVCFPVSPPGPRTSRRVGSGGTVGCASSHSKTKILKSNRRTYGRPVLVYQSEDEDDDEDDDDDEEEEVEDDEYSEFEEFDDSLHTSRKRLGHYTRIEHRKRVTQRLLPKLRGSRSSKSKVSLKLAYTSDESGKNTPKRNSKDVYPIRKSITEMSSSDDDGRGKKIAKFTESKFQKLCEEVDLDERSFPLMEYLSTYGLKESDFILIFERHMPCLQINLASARERLEFLLSVGVKSRDIKRILLRQPQILEYTVKNNLKPHVAFLTSLGVPDSRIGQIVTSAPSLFSYSIEHSLKPTVRYLVEEVGIRGDCVSKVVQLSPQILVQRIDNSWNSRLDFLSRELGAPRDNIVKMVTKHPQLLHYSIEDGIQPRINFLRSIGMRNSDILKVLTSLTQVLSLSLEANLKPKYLYLVNELHNEVQSLTKYPMYLSLSLEQRIRPRHRFLVSLKKAPKGPFPLSSLVPTDECFCQQWAGTSVDKYLAFRKSLLLREFAKKYEKKR